MRRLNSQTLILIGSTLFVLYLAGVLLLIFLYGSIRRAPIGVPGATYTLQSYVKAYFAKEFSWLFLTSVHYIGIIALRDASTSVLLYTYNNMVLSILAFDLWEGGQYRYLCVLGSVDGVAPCNGIYRA